MSRLRPPTRVGWALTQGEALVQALAVNGPGTLSELAAILRSDASTTRDVLQSLAGNGWVEECSRYGVDAWRITRQGFDEMVAI